jgi:hypothetical protein
MVMDKRVQLFILDLEHMKAASPFFKRRIKRNLGHLKRSIIFHTDRDLDDWKTFISHYKNAFTQSG